MDRINITDNAKLIKEPIGDLVPAEVKDKVELIIVEPEIKEYKGVNIPILNSKLFYVSFDADPKEVQKDIMEDMDKKEVELVKTIAKNHPNKKIKFVRRKMDFAIAELMGLGKRTYRAILVHPMPTEKPGTDSEILYLNVYGMESLVVTTE